MIVNKVFISAPFTPPQKNRPSAQNSPCLGQPAQFNTQAYPPDGLHFGDSHFITPFSFQNKDRRIFAQPNTTFIRKVSQLQMRNSKKQNVKQGENDASTIRQKIVNFFNYPIDCALFSSPTNLTEEKQGRNCKTSSTRRKSNSVCYIYQSGKKISPYPEMQAAPKRGKYQTLNPWTNREYLYKIKELQQGHRRFNSIDYSIIKPNDIQAAPICSRHRQKSKNFDRTCHDLVNSILSRQDIPQKHRQIKLERQQNRIKITRQTSSKTNIHASLFNRIANSRGERVQQRNEVQPWEVDTNMVDML